MDKSHFLKYITLCCMSLMFLSACVPVSKMKYFNDIDKLNEPEVNLRKSKTVNLFDKLNVTVLSTDMETANLLNSNFKGSTINVKGYEVDETGFISFPFVGRIQVSGLTLLETGEKIRSALSGIITKPEVIVSLIDNRVTVMGEVVNQGRYSINEDFINIYEALALGGGFAQFADRKNVVLLRSENNKLMHYKLDLTNSKIANSTLYYVLPNDIIIVEPLRMKSQQSPLVTQVLTTMTTLLSIFTLMFTVLK
jgi:polysaccharide biosynthesis/export protein